MSGTGLAAWRPDGEVVAFDVATLAKALPSMTKARPSREPTAKNPIRGTFPVGWPATSWLGRRLKAANVALHWRKWRRHD